MSTSYTQRTPRVAATGPVQKYSPIFHNVDYDFPSLALGQETGGCYFMLSPIPLAAMSAEAMCCSTVNSAVGGLVTVTVIRVGSSHACARGGSGVPAADGRTGQVAL